MSFFKKYPFLLTLLRQEKAVLITTSVLLIAAGGASTITPLITKNLIDELIAGNSSAYRWFGYATAIAILMILANWLNGLVVTRCGNRLTMQLRTGIFGKTLGAPLFGDEAQHPGEYYATITGDTEQVSSFVRQVIPANVSRLFNLAICLTATAYLDPVLLLMLVAFLPVQFLAYRYQATRMVALTAENRRVSGEYTSALQGMLGARLDIIAMREQPWAARRHSSVLGRLLATSLSTSYFSLGMKTLTGTVSMLLNSLLLGVGSYRVLSHTITVGTLTAFTAYQGRLLEPVLGLFESMVSLQQMYPYFDRISAMLKLPQMPDECPQPGETDEVACLDRISVHGGTGRPDRLNDFSCQLAPGQIVGLTGPNGSGKTTLCLVLAGLLRPYSGSVTVLGCDGAKHSWRRNFPGVVLVPQGAKLFTATVLENLGLEEETPAAMRYLSAIGLLAKISALPGGMAHELSDQRSTFSGGEAQRMLIVRALLKRPKLLLLDETLSAIATSDLPQIFSLLRESVCHAGGTVLIACHSTAVAEHCDQVLKLNQRADFPEGVTSLPAQSTAAHTG